MTDLLRGLFAAALLAAPGLTLAQEALPSQPMTAEATPSQAPCGNSASPETDAQLPAITVSSVEPRMLTDRVIASGLVAAVEEVQVQPLIEGQPINELLADVGHNVVEGQVLARLSTSTIELQLSQLTANRASVTAQIAQAEASLVQATTNAEEAERVASRAAELAAAGTVSRAQAEQTQAGATSARAAVRVAEQGVASAQAQLALVEAQIDNAELQLSRAEVKAPVSGLVIAREAQLGAIASAAGGAMFTIVRDNALEMRAKVSEQDLLRLKPGQVASLVARKGAEPVAGRIHLVEPSIDLQTRLGTARIEILDSSQVVTGMFLIAEVTLAEEEMLAVPVTAVGTGAEGATVMRVCDGIVERVSVSLGIRDRGLIGITEGLSEGDLVVTKAAAFVRGGERINPVPAQVEDEPAAASHAETDGTEPGSREPAPTLDEDAPPVPAEAAPAAEAAPQAAPQDQGNAPVASEAPPDPATLSTEAAGFDTASAQAAEGG